MAHNYSPRKTLSESNQFVFTCPIFHTKTKIAACFTLRELVWRGEKPEVRKGCQMCMATNKCPINNILKDMMRTDDLDPYHSDVPKEGKLKDRHIAQIERVTISPKMIERAIGNGTISPVEAKLMQQANDMAKKVASQGVRNASEMSLDEVAPKTRTPRQKMLETADEPLDATILAATTGNMAAAVNNAMKESGND